MADFPAFRPPADPATPAGAAAPGTESLIDRESHFNGVYRTPHNLRIDGRYEGEIECRGTVFVGETAVVNARIIAGNVTIAGQCEGEIVCESRFEILRTGRVAGSVSARTTVVHDGAFYEGELHMVRGADAQPARPAATTPPVRPAYTGPAPTTSERPAGPPVDRTPPIPAPRRRSAEADVGRDEAEPSSTFTATTPGPRTGLAGNGRAPAPQPEGVNPEPPAE